MANSDSSQYVLRFNEVSQGLEYGSGTNWFPIAISGGVTSLNTLAGAVVLAAGSNITLTPSGNTITVASTSTGGGANIPVTTLSVDAVATQPGAYIWPTSSTITLTLPDATTVRGNVYYFNGGAATTATVHPVMSQTVDGSGSDLTVVASIGIVSDGANWFTI